MAIRLRTVSGVRIALCAVETDAQPGDVYLDDGEHYALASKFAQDHQTGTEYPREWEVMATQKRRGAKEELQSWLDGEPAGLYLTLAEKARTLADWQSGPDGDLADPGIRPLMDRLNAIEGVCTVQSCIGHAKPSTTTPGATYVENGCVEMRLDERATKAFYAGMPRLRAIPRVDDVAISWRTPYQVCNVWFQPGNIEPVVAMLIEVLAPPFGCAQLAEIA